MHTIKYSFIVPYYDREQFWNTLLTYQHFYAHRNDWEVIVLEDRKNAEDVEKHRLLCTILTRFSMLPLVYRKMNYENSASPCSTRNDGVDVAEGRFIIQTNPECAHTQDILHAFDIAMAEDENQYIIPACQLVHQVPTMVDNFDNFTYTPGIWYQHSQYSPRKYHWCTCMLKKNYIAMGGFNEECDKGLAYDDDQFVAGVGRHFNMVQRDDLLVVHQEHRVSWEVSRHHELAEKNRTCTLFRSRFKLEQL
jgi:hypothetical protein